MPAHKEGSEYTDGYYRFLAWKHKEEVYNRQNGNCNRCNIPISINTKHSCLLHHVDGNKKNNDASNLILVCYSCHSIIHAEIFKAGIKKKNTKTVKLLGEAARDIKTSIHKSKIVKTENGINDTRFREIVPGLGYIKHSKYLDRYGFTLQQLGDYLGVTRERARQLVKKDPKRLETAAQELKLRNLGIECQVNSMI